MEPSSVDRSEPIPALDYPRVRETLVSFIREECRRAGFERAVVGVSGGVDSAVAVTLAAAALGSGNVLGVMMPSASSSPSSAKDAADLLRALGVKGETASVAPMVDAFLAGRPGIDRVRKGNLMARARMIVLYDISARDRSIVVGTSNRTEILLGYGTLYGDTACGLNPVGELYKTQVWGLAASLGVPRAIIDKQPSADLWEGQTDEEELGFSYAQVDRLLVRMVDEGRDDDDLVRVGFDPQFVARVRERIRLNEFKRRLPLIARVSPPGGAASVQRPGKVVR